jgi:hypothetical protein
MKAIFRAGLITVALVATGTARADVFKCTDPVSGKVTYTNSKTGEKGCTVLQKEQSVTTVPAPAPRKATPSDFPRVDNDTQRSRDNDRRKILDSELESETQALAEAKKALADQEATRNGDERNYAKVLERLKPFQEQVELHERNIDAIKTEIGRLK